MTSINKKVKIISYESSLSKKWLGMVGEIIEENRLQCLVKFNDEQTHWFFSDEFEEAK
jgi:hypothetical protein